MTTLTPPSAKLPAELTCPENELLLCCSRTDMSQQDLKRINALLQQQINWSKLLQAATRHGVMPLLYWNLNNFCSDTVPQTMLAELRASFQANAGSNLALTSELLNLLPLFEKQGISAIPYKGATLAALVYGNLALRPFSDLDILVQQREISRAEDLLIARGYSSNIDLGWEHQLVSQDGRVSIDLHNRLTPFDFPASFHFKQLWERCKFFTLADQKALTFSPEDLLLILCVYVVRDCWHNRVRLVEICDIAELIRVCRDMDWDWILKESRRSGTERILLLSLLLAQNLLEIELPENIVQRIQREQIISSLAKQVCKWLFSQFPTVERERKIFYFRVRERKRDILPFLTYRVYMFFVPNKADRKFLSLRTILFGGDGG